MNFQMFKLVLEKAEEPEIKLSTSAGSSKKQECFRKNIYFCYTDYAKTFDCVDHNKLENSEGDGIPGHLTCLLRNLYAGQEATVRTGQYTALTYSFSYLEPVCCSMSSSNCCLLACIQISQRQVRWSHIPIFFRIFHSML